MSYARVLSLLFCIQFYPVVSVDQAQSAVPVYQNPALRNIIQNVDVAYKTIQNPKVSLDALCAYYQGLHDAGQALITRWAQELDKPVVPLEFVNSAGPFLNHFAYAFTQQRPEPVIYVSCMHVPDPAASLVQQAAVIETCVKKNSGLLQNVINRIAQTMEQTGLAEFDAAYACGKQAIIEYHSILAHEYGHIALGHVVSQQWKGCNIFWPYFRVAIMRNVTGILSISYFINTAITLMQDEGSFARAGRYGAAALISMLFTRISSYTISGYESACDAFAVERSTPEQAEYFFRYLTDVDAAMNHAASLSRWQKFRNTVEKFKGKTHPTAKSRIDAMRLLFVKLNK